MVLTKLMSEKKIKNPVTDWQTRSSSQNINITFYISDLEYNKLCKQGQLD